MTIHGIRLSFNIPFVESTVHALVGPRIALVLGPGSDCIDAGNTHSLFIFEGIRIPGSRPGHGIVLEWSEFSSPRGENRQLLE